MLTRGRHRLRRRHARPRGGLARRRLCAGPAQTELIDRIGGPIGADCTSNGITITADAIIGMRHAYAVVYTIEKDDGTAFDELTMNENGLYNLFLNDCGDINELTALRLGIKGGQGYSYTFDANPSDNAIQLVEIKSLTGSDATLVGETLRFNASELLYSPKGEQADGRALPAERWRRATGTCRSRSTTKICLSTCPRDRASL